MSGILGVFYGIFPVPDIIGRSLSGPPIWTLNNIM